MKNNYLQYFLFLFIFFQGCKKENERTQWDVEVLGPVFFASLSVNDLVADSLLNTNADGSVSLVSEQTFSYFELDSIFEIPDTSISNKEVWPSISISVPPGTPFLSSNNRVTLNVSSIQLTKGIMRQGKIEIELKNSLPTNVIYTYTIPKAKKNGLAFTVTEEVMAAGPGGPGIYKEVFDLSGYEIDLTGPFGRHFNTITYNVNAQSDPNGNAFTLTTNAVLIDIKSSFSDLEPIYVKGFLGQTSINSNENFSTGLADIIQDGLIMMDSVTMDLDVDNYIGADARVFFNSLRSINTRTSTSVSLLAPTIMNRALNINRSTESGTPPSIPNPSRHRYHLDNANSNVKDFIENLPERISYNVNTEFNPLGNISFYNDFIFSDSLVNGKISINMPLRFAMQNLSLSDTQELSLDGFTNLDPLGPLTLTLVAKNGFPIEFDVQLFIINEDHTVIDSILVPGLINMANFDALYKVTSVVTSKLEIPIDDHKKESIRNSKYLGVRTNLRTPDYAQLIQLYSSYRLDLKLIANGTYYIR